MCYLLTSLACIAARPVICICPSSNLRVLLLEREISDATLLVWSVQFKAHNCCCSITAALLRDTKAKLPVFVLGKRAIARSCHVVNGMQSKCCLIIALCLTGAAGQLSDPVSGDHQAKISSNKFLRREATQDHSAKSRYQSKSRQRFTTALQGDEQVDVRCACSDEEPGDSSCPQNVQLRWTTEVSSSIYATPLITDLYSDAHKDIIVPSFVHQVEVTAADLSTA